MNPSDTPLRFDDSLRAFVGAVVDVVGRNAFDHGRALRDGFGRLGFLSERALDPLIATQLCAELEKRLGPYFSPDTSVVQPDEFGFTLLWAAPFRWELVQLSEGDQIYVDVVDRRIVGQDWLVAPKEEPQPMPPRIVFWSVKGGVGRSTALSVFAVNLAQSGLDVLVIDADLEAPGLGALLLRPEDRPRYGLLDYLTDNGLGGWSDGELSNFVAPSLLTDRSVGQGLVDVAPAVGTATLEVPENMLAKLSRAFLEDPSRGRPPIPVRTQLATFVERLASRRRYDVVLVDARAGLAELAAGTITALGATILVFGVNQTQTFDDFRYLFAHLARLPHSANPEWDWRRRFRFIHAKADPQNEDIESFRDRLYDVLSEEFYEEEAGDPEPFNFSLDDLQAPHAPIVINFDFPYMRFDPVLQPGQLKRETYRAAFAEFLLAMSTLVELPAGTRRPS